MSGCFMGGCVSLCFFQIQKREINHKRRYLCQAWRNVRGLLWSFRIKRDGGEWVGQKRGIVAWRNCWTAPRDSPLQMLFKKVVLKNFANFTGKQLFWSLILIKLQACNFIKKILQHRCFLGKLAKFLRTPFFTDF